MPTAIGTALEYSSKTVQKVNIVDVKVLELKNYGKDAFCLLIQSYLNMPIQCIARNRGHAVEIRLRM